MSKEYSWKLPTETGEKEVTCEVDGNKYHIYIGDAFVKTVFKNMSGGADVELTIAGVPCRFVSFADTARYRIKNPTAFFCAWVINPESIRKSMASSPI